jgi:hypothetical protein
VTSLENIYIEICSFILIYIYIYIYMCFTNCALLPMSSCMQCTGTYRQPALFTSYLLACRALCRNFSKLPNFLPACLSLSEGLCVRPPSSSVVLRNFPFGFGFRNTFRPHGLCAGGLACSARTSVFLFGSLSSGKAMQPFY